MAKKPATFSVSKTITEKRERIASLRDDVKRIEENKGLLQLGAKMCEVVAREAQRHDACKWATSNIYVGYGVEFDAAFEVPVTSLKDGPLTAILETAMAAGFEPEQTYDSASAYEGARVYPMKAVVGDLRVTLRIRAVVQDAEGATCRKVQVGTKLEEVPTFALVCE